jgi:hypothetical protein
MAGAASGDPEGMVREEEAKEREEMDVWEVTVRKEGE